jgi:hypothetical protein
MTSFLEIGMGGYLIGAIVYSLFKGVYFPVPFLMLFAFGFFYVGFMGLFQHFWQRYQRVDLPIEVAAAD